MPTKAYRKFEQRVASFTEDLELCDLLTQKFKAQPDTQGNVSVALGSTAAAHPTLARRRNTRQSRNICGSHLKQTMHVAFIKDIHEDFSEFLTDTMRNAAQKGVDPVRFVGDVKLEIAAREILATGGWEAAVRLVSNAIFRKLENERSTRQLIQKIAVRLGLDLDQAILTDAMPYLDTRHMLVHQDAKADEAFIRDYPAIGLKNGRIDVNDAFVATARTNIKALANHINDLMIAADLVRRQDLDGQR